MASTTLKTPTQKRPVPGHTKVQDSSSSAPEVFTPVYDDSNLSAVICSKKKQYAEYKAAVMMNEHYKRKIAKLKKNIENLSKQKDELLPLLENKKEELISANEYLLSVYQSNPKIEYMEHQIKILHKIHETYTLKIEDDKPFRDLGILKKNDDLSKLPARISQLLNQIAKQKSAPFMSSFSGIPLYDSMSESSLRRRYYVLKQTIEGSIKKAILERDCMKSEIEDLEERLKRLKARQLYRKSIPVINE